MFKLFSKVKQLTETPASIQRTIEKVHYEFDSAAERLLLEAKEIISKEDTVKTSKAERLKKLGFSIAKPVVETEQQIKDANESRRVAESILYFQQWYPMNKFITEKEVEVICKKYGLLFGEARSYKGDIPEKNLAEIEAFILRDEDKVIHNPYRERYAYEMQSEMFSMAQFDRRSTTFQRPSYRPPTELTQEQKEYREYFQPTFKICAPEKDFDTRHMQITDGYKLKYDPIVLQPVKDGYLIVSKWGLEGQDETLINEKQN